MDLSDNGDDFDNFFGSKRTKSPTRNPQQKSTKYSDPMEDLFGLEDNKAVPKKQTFSGGTSNAVKSVFTNDPNDDDDDLGFDPKKPKSGLNKSQNLFDDLLGPLDAKRPQTAVAAATKPPAISRQSTDTTTDTSNIMAQTPQRPKTSQGRRVSNISSMQNTDPLGLFNKDKETTLPANKETIAPVPKKRGTTADWLGLSVEPEAETETERKFQSMVETPKSSKITATSTKETAEVLRLPEADLKHQEDEQSHDIFIAETVEKEVLPTTIQQPFVIDATAHNIMLMNTLNQEAGQSINALKQQEEQVMMATQMKQQEKLLMEMQRKQDYLLQQQERHFHNLVQQQMKRRKKLEELMKQQQHRLNIHMQLMLSEPQLAETDERMDYEEDYPIPSRRGRENVNNQPKDAENQLATDLIQFKADNKRLELENLRLEELIVNTKSNYEMQIELLEKTYKKQIMILENHLSSLETRLRQEMEAIEIHFQTKIDALQQEKQILKKLYEEDFSNLKQDHEDELRKQRKNHEEDLEMIQEEHRRMLDSVRQAKMLEFAVVQDNGSYLQCLQQASTNLNDLTGGLKELKENMKQKIDNIHMEREKKLENREKLLEDSERRLKIIEESNEAEKQRLMELVSTLELQMSKMSKETAEENWQLRQKLASLDAEKKAFDREKEFFREQMLRDEERIKELKALQLLETQKLQVQIEEERSKLQVEKSKFELEKRLHVNTDLQKIEVETAIQVAQDATRKADAERERYYKMQRQLEQMKRELSDKEHTLGVKEDELHQELLSYRMAERASQEAQQRAGMSEQFYHNKIKMLQQRAQEVAEKESNLSQERLLLAQDRIAIHALKTKLSQQPKCSLCQLSQENKKLDDNLNVNVRSNENDMAKNINNYEYTSQGDVVDRLLDANIADSLRKMKYSANMSGWEMLLDDDHKKMVQNNNVQSED